MGFAQGLGRFFSGQPVFDTSDEAQPTAGVNNNQQNGTKYVPQVYVSRVECDIDGPAMIISVNIKNNSNIEVFLDKIRILNTVKELDATLLAGAEKEYYAVFKGNRPLNTSYSECLLEYRDTKGDYFRSHHFVEYNFETDKTYTVRNIRFTPPIRDI